VRDARPTLMPHAKLAEALLVVAEREARSVALSLLVLQEVARQFVRRKGVTLARFYAGGSFLVVLHAG